jgi:hypothetical protein
MANGSSVTIEQREASGCGGCVVTWGCVCACIYTRDSSFSSQVNQTIRGQRRTRSVRIQRTASVRIILEMLTPYEYVVGLSFYRLFTKTIDAKLNTHNGTVETSGRYQAVHARLTD